MWLNANRPSMGHLIACNYPKCNHKYNCKMRFHIILTIIHGNGWKILNIIARFPITFSTSWPFCVFLNPVPNAQVCVFDDTYYKITTTNYISKTSLYTTFCMYPSRPWPLKIFNVCIACDPWDSNIQLTMGKTGEEEGFCWKHNRRSREFENPKS
jgi:hypothetical protein